MTSSVVNERVENAANTIHRISAPVATERSEGGRARLLRAVFWIVAIALGVLQSWTFRYDIGSDGISYLDMGDAYLRGDWSTAINGNWSPFYSWLLGLAMAVFKPSPYWEYPVVRLVNLGVYLCALVCFDFFLRGVIHLHQTQGARLFEDGRSGLPEWAWLALGYSLFIWSSLTLITVYHASPDMCVAAVVYAASGILLRLRMGATKWPMFVALGLVLGVGFLVKSVMFPLGFVFLGVSLLLIGDIRKAVPRVLVASLIFLALSVPFIAALTKAKNRLTFGDSGRLMYAWTANGTTDRHWQGDPPGSGVPRHPTRKIYDVPAIYEFGSPLVATYAYWYDPSYWFEGVTLHFDPRRQVQRIWLNLKIYHSIIFDLYGSLVIGLFILLYMSRRRWSLAKDISKYWFLLIPALAAIGGYAIVWVEERYMGPFFVLLFIGLFSGVKLPRSETSKRLVTGVVMAILAALILSLGTPAYQAVYAAGRAVLKRQGTERHVYWQVADELKQMGVRPGDKVASLSYSNRGNAKWARLARVRIIAELYSPGEDNFTISNHEEIFWAADSSFKKQVMQAFARTGASAVVADQVPGWASTDGWQRIGSTKYHVYFLSEQN